MEYSIKPIAYINTPYKQKFSIPRQSLHLSQAKGSISFAPHIDVSQAFCGIEDFSHLWILFLFHENLAQGFKQKVRPPRLGGNSKIGVFASRSSFRPNGIGMSLVKNLGLFNNKLAVGGVDLVDNTPIVDIKPYLPYADSVPSATAGYAQQRPEIVLTVTLSEQAEQALQVYLLSYPDLLNLITSVLEQDPRPSYKKNKPDPKIYYIQLYNLDIEWTVQNEQALVLSISEITQQ